MLKVDQGFSNHGPKRARKGIDKALASAGFQLDLFDGHVGFASLADGYGEGFETVVLAEGVDEPTPGRC